MNQLHEDLLYVKSLVTAMGNLNKQEVQLQGAKKNTVPVQLKTLPPVKKGKAGMIALLILIFCGLLFINTMPAALSMYQSAKEQIKLDKVNDEFSWTLDHHGEKYPGYQGSEKVDMVKVIVPCAIRGGIIAFVITGIVAGVFVIIRRKGAADVEKENKRRKQQYDAACQNNQLIVKHNAEVDLKLKQIADRRTLISQEYMQNIIEWYPKDYGYPSAVDFFINLVENHLATTIQECVEQYNTHMFRQKVTDNQQEMLANQKVMINNQEIMITKQDKMIRQQMIGNAIAAVNMMANVATAGNTAQIANNTADIAGTNHQIAGNTASIAGSARDMGRDVSHIRQDVHNATR